MNASAQKASRPRARPDHTAKSIRRDQSQPSDIANGSNDEIHEAGEKSDPTQKWRFKYIEELADGFQAKVIDKSLDERLANSIYTLVSVRALNFDEFAYNSGDPDMDKSNMALAAGSQVNEEACGRHLDQMLSLLDELHGKLAGRRANETQEMDLDERHLRLARVLDSYGHYESGHLSGKQFSIGQWDQCTRTQLLLGEAPTSFVHVPTTFCWARMNLNKHLNKKLLARVKDEYEASEHQLLVGSCLPRSCHSKTFEANRGKIQQLVASQFRLPRTLFVDETLEVSSLYCPVDRRSEYSRLSLAGKLCVSFLLGWLALTVYATKRKGTNDLARDVEQRWLPSLDSLSLSESWQEFLGDEPRQVQSQGGSAVQLDVLNFVKVVGSGFVVLGHAFVLQITIAQDALLGLYLAESDPLVLIMVVGTVIVDTFFVITGLLLGHQEMKKAARAPRTTFANSTESLRALARRWLEISISRFLRLCPLYFLVFWFKRSVWIGLFSSWPLWDAGFNAKTNHGACLRESWLTPFTPMAATLPLSRQCMGQAWSLANDYSFSLLVIPPVLLALPRRPQLAFCLSVVLVIASNQLALGAYRQADPDMVNEVHDLRAHGLVYLFGGLHSLYTSPLYRLGPVVIGLLAGYLLYQFGTLDNNRANMRKRPWVAWSWDWATKASGLAVLLIVVGYVHTPHIKHYIAPNHQSIFISTFTTGRIVWSLANACLFVRMATHWRHNWLMRMFAGRYWRALARLNLAMLLVHFDVLTFLKASSTSLSYFTKREILVSFGAAYCFSLPLAVLLHVVFESPMDKLIRRHLIPKLFSRSIKVN